MSFTVSVASTALGAGTPTGTVTLTDNGNPLTTLTLSGGVATFTTTTLPGGTDSIVATYAGDPNFSARRPSSVSQQVNPADTSTAVLSSANPGVVGQAVTFTAVVNVLAPGSGTATGSVNFFDGGTMIGSSTLGGGIASFTTSSLTVGSHTITASYVATASFAASTSPGLTETVNPVPTPTPTPTQTTAPTFTPAPTTNQIIAVGTDAGVPTQVNVYNAQTLALEFAFLPFGPNFTGGARVAVADLNGDGVPDIIASAGPGGGPQIVVWDGATQQPIAGPLASFYGMAATFTGGMYVAAGDVNGDGTPDIIVGAGAGGGPQVNLFSGKDGSVLGSFYALSASFTGGVRVAAGDIHGIGRADIITAAGAGGGPQITIFDGLSLSPVASFYAFAASFTNGVFVAAGDVNGDGKADIIAGAGAGGGPQVTVFDGSSLALLSSFYAFTPSFSGGVRVGAVDPDGTGHAEILTAAGPTGGPQVTVFDSSTLVILGAFFGSNPQLTAGLYIAG